MAAVAGGRFLIDELQLGAGGYGKVYTALDTQSGEKVAAKVISPGRMKMAAIMKEVNLMSTLAHPGVIALRGHEEVDRHFVIYMVRATRRPRPPPAAPVPTLPAAPVLSRAARRSWRTTASSSRA